MGTALGVAVVGAVVASAPAGARSPVGWWILCGLGVAVLALGRLSTSRWAYSTAGFAEARKAAV